MDDLDRSRPRGFNPPLDRSVWIWIAGAAIVSVAMTYWATAGRNHAQVTEHTIPTVQEEPLLPPITQPATRPAENR